MRESEVEKYLVKLTADLGGETRKVRWLDRIGAPDRFVALPGGHHCFVELKAPGKKPRVSQQREHERLRALGVNVFVVDSKESARALVRALLGVC